MRVVVLPSDGDGSAHYRLLFPARELARQRGWRCYEPPFFEAEIAGTKRTLKHYGVYGVVEEIPLGTTHLQRRRRLLQPLTEWLLAADFDVLWTQFQTDPWWPDFIAQLRAQGKRVYVDSDDAWWGLPSWNPGSRKPPAQIAAAKALVSAADGLSVATPALAEMYAPYQRNVRVIRNRLDWGMWADVKPVYERPSRKLRVGWMGDSEYRAGDLRVMRPFIGSWLRNNPEVEFVAAGDPRVHEMLGVPQGQRVSVADTRFRRLDLADITAVMDIGLVPLDLSTPAARRLNECKSHLKGAEYNAAGIPFIASPSESYRWWEERGCGLLADTPAQWRKALDTLTDISVRHVMGRAGRVSARDYSIQRHVGEWEDWLGADRGSHPHPA